MYHSLFFIRDTLRHIFLPSPFHFDPWKAGIYDFTHYPEQEIHIELF